MKTCANRMNNMAFSPVRKVLDRARELEREGVSVVHFEIGEPDFDTPVSIVEKTKSALDMKLTHYGPNRGTLQLRNILSEQMKRENNLNYDAETEILLTSGGAEAILDTILAYIEEGDEVIILTPGYMNYRNIVALAGGTPVEVPLSESEGFQPNAKKIEEAITDKTKMLIINSPQNPTGIVYEEHLLEEVAKVAVKHDLLVLSDEIYGKIIYDDAKFISIASFPGMKERSFVVNGFSKAYAMTGWRMGYVAAESSLLLPVLKIHQYNTTCLSVFTQKGLADAMESPETVEETKNMVKTFERRRRIVLDGLKEIEKVSVVEPKGAFYVFINVGMDGTKFATDLLEKKGVALVPGAGFGKEYTNYVRMSYATAEKDIVEGLKRIKEYYQQLA